MPDLAATAGIALAALALRLYGASAQSLWYDEGTSVALATRSLTQIARDAAHDIHPPLYYWLLALWTRVWGDSIWALRGLSALIGTALVLMVILIGRRLVDRRAALAAGALAALSPYLVWYSQEVRMYILSAFWACLLVYAALRVAEAEASGGTRRGAWLALAAAVATAALFTQYLGGAGALAVAGVVVLLLAGAHWRATTRLPLGFLGRWALSQAVAVLVFLPWLAYAWPTVRHWPAISPPVSLSFVADASARTFALGSMVPPELQMAALVLATAAAAGLVLGLTLRAWRLGVLATAAWIMTPPLLLWLLSLSRPAWHSKQIIVAAPAWELALGAAVAIAPALAEARAAARGQPLSPRRRRAAHGVAVLLFLALTLPRLAALHAMYVDPNYQRDDYRGIAATIEDLAGPEDAVILNAPTQIEVYGYYDRGRLAAFPLPLGRPADRAATEARLASIAARHRDLYGILWATDESDPEGLVTAWLDDRRYKVSDTWFGNLRLVDWARARPMASVPLPEAGLRLGEDMALTRLRRPTGVFGPGEILTLEADWRAMAVPRSDYAVFTQILDAGGDLVAQRDMAPGGGSARSSTWAPGRTVTDRIGLRIPADLPPGDYGLILGLYDPLSGERLPVSSRAAVPAEAGASDHVAVGTLTIHR